jgi:choline-sulfatase
VILITLDTTRADRLGCYGYPLALTPNLDNLAREGVLFRRAYAHVPLTAPSHASILTGLLPPRHGVHDNGTFVLSTGPRTLAEVFVDAGYRTAAFVSAFVLDRRFGLGRGFATYEDDVFTGGADNVAASVRAEVTVGRAIEWLRHEDPRPLFAWVHLYDAHSPYDPPASFREKLAGRPYDGEIAYMDAEIGRLLDAVRLRRRPALVAVLGDHGESLGEHQESTHMYYVYSATQHVPFLLHLPGYLPAGRVVEPVVRGVDLMPTVLAIAGLPVPPDLDGTSLLPLVTGRSREEPGPAYLESYSPRFWWGAHELFGLRTGRWLYIRSPRPELYDVGADPGEHVNLARQHPAELAALDARLQAFLPHGDPLAVRSTPDSEAAERLSALGYVTGTPMTEGGADLLDAKDNAPLLVGFTRGRDLLTEGRPEEALTVLEKTLQINPRSLAVRRLIAETLLRLNRSRAALARFGDLRDERPDVEDFPLGMVKALDRLGRHAEAMRLLREIAPRFPNSAAVAERIGMTLEELGRFGEAERTLRHAASRFPRHLLIHLRLGVLLTRRGEVAEATKNFLAVVEASPRSREAQDAAKGLIAAGGSLLDRSDFETARTAYRGALEAGMASVELFWNLGLADYRLGRRDEALEVLRQGVSRLPDSSRLHYRLGRLLQETGQAKAAAAEYRRALELKPDNEGARRALERLGVAATAPTAPGS